MSFIPLWSAALADPVAAGDRLRYDVQAGTGERYARPASRFDDPAPYVPPAPLPGQFSSGGEEGPRGRLYGHPDRRPGHPRGPGGTTQAAVVSA